MSNRHFPYYFLGLIILPILFAGCPDGRVTLTVVTEGAGAVNVNPSAAEYDPGTSVTLTAMPTNGWAFMCWRDGASGSDNPTTVKLDGNKVVTAVFGARPIFTKEPSSLTVNPGEAAEFSVSADGTVPLVYQWHKDGNALSGATAAIFSIPAATQADEGVYVCQVSNAVGEVTSQSAILTVADAPVITVQPTSQSVNPGTPAVIRFEATGTEPMTYQWRKDGTDVPGATAAAFTIESAQESDEGIYACLLANSAGSVQSVPVLLTVNNPPTITTQPKDQTVNPGTGAVFVVSADGSGPFTYQWTKEGVFIEGATSFTYAINACVQSDEGHYACRVTNSAGAVVSETATLAVNDPPTITSQPLTQTAEYGCHVALSVTASGSGTLSFVWRKDDVVIPGATAAIYTIDFVQTSHTGVYTCTVSNTLGEVTSIGATLTVNPAPVLSVMPLSQSVSAESVKAEIQVANSGGGVISWNATIIDGADWINLSSGTAGVNTGTLTVRFTDNPDSIQRSATIRVSGTDVTGTHYLDAMVLQLGKVGEVTFPDANLERVVRQALNKPTGKLFKSDLAVLDALNGARCNIANLSGLENAVNLQSINLSGNAIVDISPLTGLTHMQTLNLASNKISDISPLVGLIHLATLVLSDNQLANVPDLSGLTALRDLDLAKNRITNANGVSNIKTLINLVLSQNTLSSLAFLETLPNLYSIVLDQCELTSLDTFRKPANLGSLSLAGNKITNLNPLADCTSLLILILRDNQVTSLAGLSTLTELTELDLSHNQISDLVDLQGLSNLVNLNLSDNLVRDAAALVANKGLDQDDHVDLLGNVLNIDTITNQIPALQARGVVVYFGGAGTVVTFKDAHLESTIRTNINKPTGTIIDTDLATVEYINAESASITDLSGLEYCYNLRFLFLAHNAISDLTPLASLHYLEKVYLAYNQITELVPLAGMTTVTELSLSSNHATNLAPLAGLTGLTSLDLANNGITNITPLQSLPALRILLLTGNQITSLASLNGLATLDMIEAGENQVTDLTPLASLSKLTRLYVEDNQISTLTPLSGLGLVEFNGDGNPITTLLPLTGVKTLQTLSVQSCQISDLAPLVTLTNLSSLSLAFNQITDLLPLVNNPGIDARDQLDLRGNSLSSQAVSAQIPALTARNVRVFYGGTGTTVYFSDANLERAIRNAIGKPTGTIVDTDLILLEKLDAPSYGIVNLTGIQYCPNLRQVYLEDNQIGDLTPLANLAQLEEINIARNQVTTLVPLAGLKKVRFLDARENYITQVSALTDLTKLTYLFLSENTISDLSALSPLTDLIALDLHANQISDINPLATLTKLQGLDLRRNTIANLNAVAGMAKLVYLYISQNQIEDLSPLSGLGVLQQLQASSNRIQQLTALAALTGLTELDLSNNQIRDIKPLIDNPGIASGDRIDLKGNPLSTDALSVQIPALVARNVIVYYDAKSGTSQEKIIEWEYPASPYYDKQCEEYFPQPSSDKVVLSLSQP